MRERMDKDLFYISLFLMFIGIAGQLSWFFFGVVPHTQASFQEMQNVSGYALLIGLILLPAGLFKDGLPAPGYVAKVFIGVILVVTIGVAFTGALLLPGATSTGPRPDGFITILYGSQVPGTPITFSPQNVTVIIGVNNTVQWTNLDTAPHTVTSVAGSPTSFNSGAIATNGTFVYQFTQPGVYNYYCTFHPGWMKGTVTVKTG